MGYRRTFTLSPRLRQKRQKALKQKIVLSGLAVLAFIALLSFVSHYKYLTIDTVVIEGNRVLTPDDVRGVVETELSGRYLLLFSKSNIVIYPKKRIKEALLKTYKRIKGVRVALENLKSLQSIKVSITEREGKYLWCGDTLPENDEVASCYYVDDSSFLFAEAPYFSGNVFFRFYSSVSRDGTDKIIGNFLLPPEEFERLIFFKDFLRSMDIETQALVVKEGENYELLIASGPITEAPLIIFNKKDDFERILNNLGSALETEPFATDFREKLSSLLYIDLRFGNKVIYKFE